MDFNFKKINLPKIEPSYICGENAYRFFDKINSIIKKEFDSNNIFNISIEKKNGIDHLMYKGFLDLVLINKVLGKDKRVVHYEDKILNEYFIPEMFREYRDQLFPQLIIQDSKSSNIKKSKLIKGLLKIIEEKEGYLKFPLIVSGLSIENSLEKGGYGVNLIPRGNKLENLNVYTSNSLKYTRSNIDRFNLLDKNGIPLRDTNGKIEISLKKSGTAVLSTNKKLMFDAGYGSMTNKGSNSAVIIVRNRPRYTGKKIIY